MRRSIAYREPEPFSAINTTPLIDVMLVLLIMMIITIPTATHKLPVELPQGPPGQVLDAPHRLDIAANGALAWDGRAIADAELPVLLAAIVAADGVLHFKADEAARYERFAEVLTTVKRAGVTKLGFVGNERMAFD
ncbi:biopolymer transporter ExbD [Sphingomonas sp. BT-65]|uniref:ExbD/TolR family protein n=1 Tax=Sphingomonas sp. BT-65 TaxID=2989821 RepID=UPI002236BA0E|nr:biopolymer transporter ExbD [Sphingomonas sp. BT-65]MCW4462837.1 biopolymer transporter ExbD [Sphingomonas sp. BT-65]